MTVRIFLAAICVLTLGSAARAQDAERRPVSPAPQAQSQQPGAGSIDAVVNEIGQLRKSVQALTARLREVSENLAAPDSRRGDTAKEQQNRIALGLDILSRAELRAEVLRKQLLDLIEKETAVKSRLMQLEEDMRPESIERAASLSGSTRTLELREVRRRVLENERRGYESLLRQTSQSRARLEEDVRDADALISRLRQRVLPKIEKEIDKLNPN
jgi:hypothetical protein